MTTGAQESGGIHAKRIQADNVVSGVQVQGGDPQKAAALVQLTQAIRRGEISADDIFAKNLVSGLQYLADPAKASTEDIRHEVVTLREKVNQAIAAQEIPDEADANDAKEGLTTAEVELAKSQPNGRRVLRKLDEVSSILAKSAEAAEATGKIGALVIQLAPVAATLWQFVQKVFGM